LLNGIGDNGIFKMKYEDIQLIKNEPIHNFELFVDGQRAFIDYKQKDNKVYLIHTEVPETLKGKGVAEAIVEKTLTYLEANHYKLVPLCSYVQMFLKRHPDWNRLL
jgi:predicted GNAT family acetyltransferase